MSNVIEDNLTLRKELKEAFNEINRLELQNIQRKQVNYELVDQVEKLNLKVAELSSGGDEKKQKKKVVEESIRQHLDD